MHGEKRVALVTGGAQGIGKAISKQLLSQGLNVVIIDMDVEAGEEACREIGPAGQVHFAPADVAVEDQVSRAVAQCVDHFGRLDVLVNNAGVSRRTPVTELTLEQWNRVIAVNLSGAFLCSKYATPHLRQHHGAIVNISSTRALMSEADTEAYAATKGGLMAMTHALAVSLGPRVRVNCVSPGWIDVSQWQKQAARHEETLTGEDHRQHPAGRVGKPEDVASLVGYLVSPEAGFITGANFVVDGGMTRKMIYAE